MALTDYKITNTDVTGKGVQSAPDRLTGTAAENKAVFDRLIAEVVKEKLNALIDGIVAELAGKMPAPGNTGSVGQYLKVGESGVEWDTPSGAGDMLKSAYDKDNDGRVDEADTALVCRGNAATATKLETGRGFTVKDNSQSNAGPAATFDGGGDVVLKLPGTIKASLVGSVTGNAATATKLAAKRKIGGADFDGSAPITLEQMGAAALEGGKLKAEQASAAMVSVSADTTLALGHAGKCILIQSGAVSVTVPANAAVAFPTGTEIEIIRYSGSACTLKAATGVALLHQSLGSVTEIALAERYTVVGLKKVETNNWVITGGVG